MKGSQSRMSHLADRRPNLATRVPYLLVDEGLPEQDEPLGGQKAKPGHQGEHHGQPEPVPSEYRQGPE